MRYNHWAILKWFILLWILTSPLKRLWHFIAMITLPSSSQPLVARILIPLKEQQSIFAADPDWKSCIEAVRRIVETEKGEILSFSPSFEHLPLPSRGEGGQQQAGVENEAGEA